MGENSDPEIRFVDTLNTTDDEPIPKSAVEVWEDYNQRYDPRKMRF